MREILFRAWDKTTNKYRKFDGMHDTMIIDESGEIRYYNLQNGSGGDEYILEQFTGLLDKNGVKIFEGDIVRDGKGGDGVVEYRDEIASFLIRVNNKTWYLNEGDPNRKAQLQYTEVIGNIHDNKELLEVVE